MENKYFQKYYKYKKKYLNLKKKIGGASLAVAEESSDEIDFSKYNTYNGETDEGWTILSSLPNDTARLNLVQNTIINGNRPTEIFNNLTKYKNGEIKVPPTILFYLFYEIPGIYGYNFPYLGIHELEIIKDAIRNDTSDKKIVIAPSGIGKLVFDILVCTKNINVVIIDLDKKQIEVFLAKFMDLRKKITLNTHIRVITSDVLNLSEKNLKHISNADIIAVPNLIHFFDNIKLKIFMRLIRKRLKVNGRLYLFWQPNLGQKHSIKEVNSLLTTLNFKVIDRKRLYHQTRTLSDRTTKWMREVEYVPDSEESKAKVDSSPINVSLILKKN
tara:strand:- start:366 stop:1352 length:987 start_codon:yes stop_codon:yes gene_type:complete